MQLKLIFIAHVWYINMTLRLSGHIYKCSFVVFVLKSPLRFARQWSREKLAILSLKPLLYRTWTIVLPDLLIYFTIKLESLTNASDASTELILQFPCKLKKKNITMHCRWKSTYTSYFFLQIKTHSHEINDLTCKTMLIEYNVLKCNLILQGFFQWTFLLIFQSLLLKALPQTEAEGRNE